MKALRLDTSKLWWAHVLSAPRKGGEHINIAEAIAHVLSLFRRLRSPGRIGRRGIYVLDSGAAVCAFAKGRSSARGLAPWVKRGAALRFAGGFLDFFLWVPSEENPSGEPSRAVGLKPKHQKGPVVSASPPPILAEAPSPETESSRPREEGGPLRSMTSLRS